MAVAVSPPPFMSLLEELKQFVQQNSIDETEADALVSAALTEYDSDTNAADASGYVTPDRVLNPGTKHATPVYVADSQRTGPTIYVVGGQHGDERAGREAAAELAQCRPDRGRLVIVPRASPVACRNQTHVTEGVDVNRTWTPDGMTHPVSAAIWADILTEEPDMIVDLHTSHGIYQSSLKSGVGQVIFPTQNGVDAAAVACGVVNDHDIRHTAFPADYEYVVGNVQGDPDQTLLVDHAGRELPQAQSYLIESTRYGTTLQHRVRWMVLAVRALVEQEGVFFG